MTDAINKLIEDNLWRDISGAPKDGTYVDIWVEEKSTAYRKTDVVFIDGFWWRDGVHIECGNELMGAATATKFHSIPNGPDDRCAKALKVAVEALIWRDSRVKTPSKNGRYFCKIYTDFGAYVDVLSWDNDDSVFRDFKDYNTTKKDAEIFNPKDTLILWKDGQEEAIQKITKIAEGKSDNITQKLKE